jgi:uncharacterized protein YdeI (YjbR/CyaY-like superfamily)
MYSAIRQSQIFGLDQSHRKEFVRWINDATREQTRQRRTAETLTMLPEGRVRS